MNNSVSSVNSSGLLANCYFLSRLKCVCTAIVFASVLETEREREKEREGSVSRMKEVLVSVAHSSQG